MKWSLKAKVELHKAKVKIAEAQIVKARRRLELYRTIAPLIKHPADKKIIQLVLSSKNISPRYW